ncbi:MFS transporter [Kocuria coralli]|uniref:MFS transporter n=1 Tax=Kocuria coralli TaxID=1461025 RepID=A0A5J5KYC0_9MICC|nr:MFS transporter [Kocuria coralli]KAA9394300.1 MFS transporter [Kocuria coralli]
MTKSRGPAMALVGIAILITAITLRPGATSVGSVLAEIREGLDLSSGTAGLLTALPGFMFAVAGVAAVPLARRLGVGFSIALGLLLMAAGLLARPYVGAGWVFVLLSALALSGMAVGNVLVPAVIRMFGGSRPALLAGLYSTGLAVGGAVPLLIAGWLLDMTGGWRNALASWGGLAAVALAVWMVLMAAAGWRLKAPSRQGGGDDDLDSAGEPAATTGRMEPVRSSGERVRAEHAGQTAMRTPVWRSPTAVALTVFFGLQSTNAYIQFGWMAQIYRDAGLSLGTAAAMVGVVAFIGVPGGFAMSWLVSHSPRLATWITGMGLCMILGYGGLLVAPATVPLAWAILLGLGSLAFPTALALITARTRDPMITARVSGFTQPAGYLMAGLGPLLIGLIHGATGSWAVPLVLLALSAVPLTYFGRKVSRETYVDDELERRG